MRSNVVIIIATIGLLFTHGTKCTRSYTAHYVKHRTKPREIRGFQPEILSTAYGFGKRDGGVFGVPRPDHNHQNMLLALLQKSTQRLANRRAACPDGNTSFKFGLCE